MVVRHRRECSMSSCHRDVRAFPFHIRASWLDTGRLEPATMKDCIGFLMRGEGSAWQPARYLRSRDLRRSRLQSILQHGKVGTLLPLVHLRTTHRGGWIRTRRPDDAIASFPDHPRDYLQACVPFRRSSGRCHCALRESSTLRSRSTPSR